MSLQFVLRSILLSLIPLSLTACNKQHENFLILPGIVETQEVRLSSKVGGRVDKVLVNEGDIAEAGQQLVVLDAAELNAKREQLIAQQDLFQAKLDLLCNGPLPEQVLAARAGLDIAEAQLKRLKAGSRSEEVQMARFQTASSQAESERAVSEYNRLKALAASNTISQSDLDTARAAMLRATSQVSSSAKNLELLINGARPEDIEEAQAHVEKMRADYDLIKRGARDEERRQAKAQVDEVVARIDELDVQLRECTITSPQRCRIEIVAIRRGDVVAPNMPVLRVLYDEDLWVKAYVPETQLAEIKLNQSVKVTHDGSNEEFEGHVSNISNISEFTPRNVQSPDERHNQVFGIKVLVDGAKGIFKSGMAATIRIPVETPVTATSP